MKFKLIIFAIFTLVLLFPFLRDTNIIHNNDLNGNIVPLLYFKDSLMSHGGFPMWNPYLNQGIPTTADPLYGIFNPLIGIPIVFLPYQEAIKVMYVLASVLACFSMYFLLKLFKIREAISLLIALTYASSSYFVARVNAGHLEKVVSFGFLPIFIYSVIKTVREKNLLWSGITSIVLSLILFSGDIYNALYCLYALGIIFLFFLIKDRKISLYLFTSILLFFLFSSVKIIPMIELQDYISKIKEPLAGSMNIPSIIYYLFFPFDNLISRVIAPNLFLSNAFGWWESLAFIGPLSILGIVFIFLGVRKAKNESILFFLLSLLFLIMAMPAHPLNPLSVIVSRIGILQYFHVPSRVLLLWSVVILVALGAGLDKWKKKKLAVALLAVNLLIVFLFSREVLTKRKFEKTQTFHTTNLEWIAKNNPKGFFTVHEISQGDISQDVAILNNILLLQSNYGLFLKNSPGEKYNFRGNNQYKDIEPGFVLSNLPIDRPNLKKIDIQQKNNKGFLYLNSQGIPFAKVGNRPIKAEIGVNKISISVDSKNSEKLSLIESTYPGWKLFIDGKEKQIPNGRFLATQTLPGRHTYEFKFLSNTFLLGLLISSGSFIFWTWLCKKKN